MYGYVDRANGGRGHLPYLVGGAAVVLEGLRLVARGFWGLLTRSGKDWIRSASFEYLYGSGG